MTVFDRDDITAKVICSSFNPMTRTRIDTIQLRYPRIVHADFMTHRVFSRNASSSRAIPVASMLARDQVFIPNFRYNKPGMQPGENLSPSDQKIAAEIWNEMIEFVMKQCQLLSDKHGLNIHKQWVNRPTEWFGYIDVVVTSTDWDNFMLLRDHEAAQDEIQIMARKIKKARDAVTPTVLKKGEWHLPYITKEDWDYLDFICDPARPDLFPKIWDSVRHIFSYWDGAWGLCPKIGLLLIISAARCCRVSYAKHDGETSTLEEDVDRFLRLIKEGEPVHASPMEHQAYPVDYEEFGNRAWDDMTGNFRNFVQFRKLVPNEAIFEDDCSEK